MRELHYVCLSIHLSVSWGGGSKWKSNQLALITLAGFPSPPALLLNTRFCVKLVQASLYVYLYLLQGSSFSVTANESITVRSITVRGSKITSLKDELGKTAPQ